MNRYEIDVWTDGVVLTKLKVEASERTIEAVVKGLRLYWGAGFTVRVYRVVTELEAISL